MCPYHSSILTHIFPVVVRLVARSRAPMTANLPGGTVKAAYKPPSLVMKSMEYILIVIFVYIAINVTEQVIRSIGASASSNAPIHINCNHVPTGMTFYIGTGKGVAILAALHEPGNLAQHIVIGDRNIGLTHVVQDLNSALIHFPRGQQMIVYPAPLGFDKI